MKMVDRIIQGDQGSRNNIRSVKKHGNYKIRPGRRNERARSSKIACTQQESEKYLQKDKMSARENRRKKNNDTDKTQKRTVVRSQLGVDSIFTKNIKITKTKGKQMKPAKYSWPRASKKSSRDLSWSMTIYSKKDSLGKQYVSTQLAKTVKLDKTRINKIIKKKKYAYLLLTTPALE